ncbi:hypothetical protein Micbo1qcDRAFT_24590 [Microdochium bolleyi]|uniref:Transmembrane protein n=1 Tax=Microdochium bolleyi TaxID=196109 RepID=A0A136JDC2_9PEZI|nr:hypothetical protein Micbo1qcDRAFT_24590 [Microdochium bolleyi]
MQPNLTRSVTPSDIMRKARICPRIIKQPNAACPSLRRTRTHRPVHPTPMSLSTLLFQSLLSLCGSCGFHIVFGVFGFVFSIFSFCHCGFQDCVLFVSIVVCGIFSFSIVFGLSVLQPSISGARASRPR